MVTRRELEAQIRFHLDQLPIRNAYHDFEHLCIHLARARICPNVLPSTGPVSSGGDQGRDFESYRVAFADSRDASCFAARTSDLRLAFACTTQRKGLPSKLKSDVRKILQVGNPVDRIYFLCVGNIVTAKRHELEEWAVSEHLVELIIHDGQWIAQELSQPDLVWIACECLAVGCGQDQDSSKLGLHLDALAIHEIRDFEQNWQMDDQVKLESDIRNLHRFTDRRYSLSVRNELMSAMGSLVRSTRSGVQLSTVEAVGSMIRESLPIITLVGKQPIETDGERVLIETGCYLGFDVAHSALRYLHDLVICNIGLDILWEILRFGEVNSHEWMLCLVLDQFSRLEASAEQLPEELREDALRWIQFKREDALAVETNDMPPTPSDLLERYPGLHI